jgi:hypothetical protein
MTLRFTARETIPVVFFSSAMCSVVITLTGKMGATYAVPFPVITRSVFGMYGSLSAICIRGKYVDQAIITTRLTLLSVCRTDVDGDPHCPSWQLSPAMLGSNLAKLHPLS